MLCGRHRGVTSGPVYRAYAGSFLVVFPFAFTRILQPSKPSIKDGPECFMMILCWTLLNPLLRLPGSYSLQSLQLKTGKKCEESRAITDSDNGYL